MGDVGDAVQSGRREALQAIRDRLAAALDEVDDRYAAPLAKQLAEVIRELESITPEEGSVVDQLAARRDAKGSGDASSGVDGVGGRRGRPGRKRRASS